MRGGSIAGTLLALAVATPAAAAPQQVLYVGDSLGVGTTPLLARELGSSARVQGDSRTGRPSGEGLRVLQQRFSASDETVVFDLGTNDDPAQPRALAGDLAAARRVTGRRCLIVATLNRPPLNGVPVDGLNHAVLAFADSAENVQLIDWNAVAASEPSLLGPDRMHPTPQGYAVRAQLFAEAVSACSAPATSRSQPQAEPAPAPARRKRQRKPQRQIKVPGIESSGISFTEPVRFKSQGATLNGELLLPNTKPPFPAVVMLHGSGRVTREPYRQAAETFASHGIATLIYDKRGAGQSTGSSDYRYSELAADARQAVALLARRDDVRSVALWGLSEGDFIAPMVAAGNRDVAAVLVVSPSAIAPAAQQDWAVRHSLGGGTAPIGTYYRLASHTGETFSRRAADLSFKPARWWARVGQPVLAVWGTKDTLVPIRASAQALESALAAGSNRDRSFRWFAGANHSLAIGMRGDKLVLAPGFLEDSVRWLRSRLSTANVTPRRDTRLPPANGKQEVDRMDAGLAAPGVQLAWLVAPLLLVAVALAREGWRRRTAAAAGCALAALAAIAAGVAVAVSADGVGVAHVAGIPALFALAFVLVAAGAVLSADLLMRRAWLAGAGVALWLALALFWLV